MKTWIVVVAMGAVGCSSEGFSQGVVEGQVLADTGAVQFDAAWLEEPGSDVEYETGCAIVDGEPEGMFSVGYSGDADDGRVELRSHPCVLTFATAALDFEVECSRIVLYADPTDGTTNRTESLKHPDGSPVTLAEHVSVDGDSFEAGTIEVPGGVLTPLYNVPAVGEVFIRFTGRDCEIR